ncbi:MAG TPA: restriction endonuclease subunit S [Bacilli bacterium]|jgi:type I restriction enzyme S subunit|nr:restriction endonuclease subunit S [Bacilli bacterium]
MNIKLGDLCKIQAGGTPSRNISKYWENGDIPWVKIGDIESKFLNKTTEFITKEGLNNSSAKMIEKGSILYTIFATLGEVCITNIDVTTNQAIAGLTLRDDKVDLEYLYYFLKSLHLHVNSIGRGVAQNNINLTILREFSVPVPNRKKQLEIANILKVIENIIESRKKQIQEYDQLIKSRFVEMFGNPIKNDKEWKLKFLDEVCDVRDGTHDSPKYYNVGYPLITSKNISNGNIDYSTAQLICEEDYQNINKRSKVDNGDILMPMIGTVGGAIIVRKERDFAIKNVALIKFNTKLVENTFIKYVLNSDQMNLHFEDLKKGGTQKFIGLKTIRNLPIIVPPIKLQSQFATFVQQVDKLKFEVQKSLDESQTLFDSLMQEYFG